MSVSQTSFPRSLRSRSVVPPGRKKESPAWQAYRTRGFAPANSVCTQVVTVRYTYKYIDPTRNPKQRQRDKMQKTRRQNPNSSSCAGKEGRKKEGRRPHSVGVIGIAIEVVVVFVVVVAASVGVVCCPSPRAWKTRGYYLSLALRYPVR